VFHFSAVKSGYAVVSGLKSSNCCCFSESLTGAEEEMVRGNFFCRRKLIPSLRKAPGDGERGLREEEYQGPADRENREEEG